MAWTILVGLVSALLLAVLTILGRRAELRRMSQTVDARTDAKTRGSHQAQLQYPHIDLSACIGCGTCVAACPEEGVLGLVHGQAAVIHGARCVGHGRCAEACPTEAITVTLGNVAERTDLPALTEHLEAQGTPGLFLAGEVTGYALIRTAITQGTAVAEEVARRTGATRLEKVPAPLRQRVAVGVGTGAPPTRASRGAGGAPAARDVLDLCIVGAGPSGLACSLGARARGLSFVTIDQADELGGTVAQYPRRKLVMTQPVTLPLHGTVRQTELQKEELVTLWQHLAKKHELPIRLGEEFVGLERGDAGVFTVRTRKHEYRARHVCLGIGRRGTPRQLDVPGEELPKVAYSLIDAQSYQGRRILVVGGGDSAIEAAVGLAGQPGNQVTLSYRKAAFFRLKAKNEQRLEQAIAAGDLEVLFESRVLRIEPDLVAIAAKLADGHEQERVLANDEVFVFAGGIPPFPLLQQVGVSFDPADREAAAPLEERGTGLLRAMVAGLTLATLALVWTLIFAAYYGLPPEHRAQSELHDLLRPSGPLGLTLGIGSAVLILGNLLYLLRRSRLGKWIAGSLQDWLSYHIVTGLLAMLFALLHGALQPRNTSGGHAFVCLLVLVATGAIGRYLYSFLPRAANGRELALDEIRSRLAALSGEWDVTSRGFGDTLRAQLEELVRHRHWERSFLQRLRGLLGDNLRLRRSLHRLRALGEADGIPRTQVSRMLGLVRRAQREAQAATHYEDLRGLLASWRFLHRWVALLMVLLVVVHVVVALRYGGFAR